MMIDNKPKRKEKPKNETQSFIRRWRMVLILLVVGLIGCFASGVMMMNRMTDMMLQDFGTSIDLSGEEARTAIEESLEITLPDSATDFSYQYMRFTDWQEVIQLTLPADEVGTWLATAGLACDVDSLDDFSPPTTIPHESGLDYVSRETPMCDAEYPYQSIRLDLSEADVTIITITTFTI